jgi:hypothetical protein
LSRELRILTQDHTPATPWHCNQVPIHIQIITNNKYQIYKVATTSAEFSAHFITDGFHGVQTWGHFIKRCINEIQCRMGHKWHIGGDFMLNYKFNFSF